MGRGHWDNFLPARISRRRALAAAGGSAAAAVLLAACGGDDGGSKTSGEPESASSLVYRPEDTSKQAKRGGSVRYVMAEPASLEPHIEDLITLNTPRSFAYAGLVMDKPGKAGPPEFKEILPYLAESWEFSPDHLTLTMKIRQDVKFHNKPPVNGRLMDTQDIVFSWNRYAKVGGYRGVYANTANSNAPIISITAPDAKTIVVKSAFPAVDLLPLLGAPNSARPCILPKETDSTFNPKGDMIGTGPFMLSSYQPSVGFVWRRHPEYIDKVRPYLDQIDGPFIPDYAAALAQFQAGSLYSYTLRPLDQLDQKLKNPVLQLAEYYPQGFGGGTLRYGWQPAGRSPFRDERVRQAVSYAMDRNLFIDTFFEVPKFEAAGIPMKKYWSSSAYATFTSWHLDPRDKEFGPNAKYYNYDIAEAKKLMAAAAYGSGFEVKSYRVQQPIYGPDHFRQVEVMDQFAKEIGIRTSAAPQDYASEYIPKIREGRGNYEGYGHTLGPAPCNDAISAFVSKYSSKGGTDFLGFDVNGKGDNSGDPKVEADIEKARREFDVTKRRAIFFDLQRYLAQKQYGLSYLGATQAFAISWPVIRNYYVEQGDQARSGHNAGQFNQGVFDWWLDDSQPPLKKA